jgi:uncharacterized protein
METIQNQPLTVQKEDRIAFLDVLNGAAILCVFIANIPVLSGFYQLYKETAATGLNLATNDGRYFVLKTIIDIKFYAVFSLLFGIGITLQYKNIIKKGQLFGSFFKRRMFWLLVLGGIHLTIFCLGTILSLYAVLGFGLLFFIVTEHKKLIRWSIILILLPILNTIALHYFHIDYPSIFLVINSKIAAFFQLKTEVCHGVFISEWAENIRNLNLLTFFKITISDVSMRIYFLLTEVRLYKVFGVFLIGIWFSRQIFHFNLNTNSKLLKRIALYGLLAGITISISSSFFEASGDDSLLSELLVTISYALGTVSLALGYFAGLALLYQKRKIFLNYFAPVGKIALSNYIFQTLIPITIYYNVGFGMAGTFGYTVIILIALLMLIGQIFIEQSLVKQFPFGPIE